MADDDLGAMIGLRVDAINTGGSVGQRRPGRAGHGRAVGSLVAGQGRPPAAFSLRRLSFLAGERDIAVWTAPCLGP